MSAESTDDPVRAQYETYPYPERDPAAESRRLLTGSPSLWPELRHHVLAGRTPRGPFRILVAGGGTGDALCMLAQQTTDAGVDARILYLDLSDAALATARARIAARGLEDRVTFVRAGLDEAPAYAETHGPFDYIDCCGVLHHLTEPAAGFRALAGALAPGGGLGLMVYGAYGRTGVYELQEALRTLAPADLAPAERVAAAREVLAGLPATNRFARNPHLRDHLASDAGVYDLLLHSTDRAYRADDLMAELEAAGLRLASWIDPLRYAPEMYLPEGPPAERAAVLDPAARAALAEALAGNMTKHIAYAVRADDDRDPAARPGPSAVPVFRDAETAAAFAGMPKDARSMPIRIDGLDMAPVLPPGAQPLIARIDGRRTLEDIRKSLPDRPGKAAFRTRFAGVYRALNGFSKLFLAY